MMPTPVPPTPPPSPDDPLRLLAPLRRQLRRPQGKENELESLRPRLEATATAVTALLITATAPLPAPLRILAQALSETYGLWITRLEEGGQAAESEARLALLNQLLLSLMTHNAPPRDLWRRALKLTPVASEHHGTLGAMLAMTIIHPEGYSPRALWFLRSLLLREGYQVALRQLPPDQPEGWHWLDSQGNFSNTSLRISRPTANRQLLFFDCTALAARTEAVLEAVQENPGHPLLQEALMPLAEVQSTLRRAAEQWHSPAQRRFSRRRQDSRISLCTRLDQLWSSLGEGTPEPTEISDWMVLNESAGGYALMHAKGPISGLQAGSALGLRLEGKPWSLCLVRWVRSENSAHVEVGVELLSPQGQPVRLTLPGREPQPAFLMPAVAGQETRETLLAPREDWGDVNTFTLLTEKSGQLRITSCLRGAPRHQTSGIEVFEFQRIGRS